MTRAGIRNPGRQANMESHGVIPQVSVDIVLPYSEELVTCGYMVMFDSPQVGAALGGSAVI